MRIKPRRVNFTRRQIKGHTYVYVQESYRVTGQPHSLRHCPSFRCDLEDELTLPRVIAYLRNLETKIKRQIADGLPPRKGAPARRRLAAVKFRLKRLRALSGDIGF